MPLSVNLQKSREVYLGIAKIVDTMNHSLVITIRRMI